MFSSLVRRPDTRPTARTAIALALAFAATGCGSTAHPAQPLPTPAASTSPGGVPSPTGDLYQPPRPLPSAPPGTLIWASKDTSLPIRPPSTVWLILYHSRNQANRDVAVSGYAIVPDKGAARTGREVFAWAHGTVGLGDQCAPSHDLGDNLAPYGGRQLQRGAVVVATDYDGLGTPGVPTDGVGVDEGRAVLDSVRAVAHLPRVGTLGDVVLAGHSQGGAAVLFAAQIQRSYAPELHLVGSAALAPGVELPALVDSLSTSPGKGMVLIGAIGLRAAYPNLDLAKTFTKSALADVPRIESECADATVARYQAAPTDRLFASSPNADPTARHLLEENSAGAVAPAVPIFIAHGGADQQVPVALSQTLAAKYCAEGVTVSRRVYQGVDHDGVIDAANADVLAFVADRFDHRAAANSCAR
jgi:pimeloyl-ACP methyl ester carboxylesterase